MRRELVLDQMEVQELSKMELVEINGGSWIGDALRWCKRQINGLSELLDLF